MNDTRQLELAALVQRVAAGDRRAFRDLYDRTCAKLLGVIRRIVRQEGAAEEVLQEAYVKIWRGADDFDPSIASPVAWMTTIARHAAIDAVRRGAERVSAAGQEIDADLIERLPDPAAGAERFDAGRQLMACLEGLDGNRREMVLLAYCQGWSRDELAARYDCPAATIKTLLRRSLIALRECLGGR